MNAQELHKHLLSIVPKRDEDYVPWGSRDREPNGQNVMLPDCSWGCRYFVELQGQLGADWGVCINPKSHRCGLLTFEHQGCPEFVQGQESE